jgi:predicted deacylase
MRIGGTVDFERPGKQLGFLRLPYSTHESAYGFLRIPIACIAGGDGPSLLLLGGNHGDEYEGPVALLSLLRGLDPAGVKGRIICLPGANFPALLAGRRASPLDGGNLNRAFPGDPAGTPSQQIASYIETILLALCSHAIDLHSGGSSLLYVPAGVGNLQPGDTPRNHAVIAMLRAFAAPVSFLSDTTRGAAESFASAAIRQGVVAIGTEAGGGGMLSMGAIAMVRRGLQGVLHHLGVIEDPPDERPATRLLDVGDASYFVHADSSGLFEPLAEPGEMVQAGQQAAWLHPLDQPWADPEAAFFARDGFVLCRRVQGLASPGDCLFHLGTDRAG